MKNSEVNAFVAYHEAGHVVVSWCLKVRVRRATIVSDDDSAGHVQNEREKPNTNIAIERGNPWHPSRLRLEKRVMVLLAGVAAQRRYNPRSVRRGHYLNDLLKCGLLLLKFAPHEEKPDSTLHCKLLYKWTESLIEQHWHLVEAVAKALLEHRELSGTQVRAVIDAASTLA